MPTTKEWTDTINEQGRAEAERLVDELLEILRHARAVARLLDQKVDGHGNPTWQMISARRKTGEPWLTLEDRRLLVYGTSEIDIAAKRVLWRMGFISGSQSHSDEKPSEEPE